MARVLKPYNVDIFIPELPPAERERIFHGLLAWNGPDAVMRAMRRVFTRKGPILGKQPKRMVIALNCFGEVPTGEIENGAGKKG